MKKISFLLAALAIFTFSTTQAQKRYLSGDDIPSEITSYVQKHFPDASIRKVKEEKKPLKTEYEVKLTPKAELEFDGEYKIKEIEAKAGFPTTALPEKVAAYLSQNYPDVAVKEWELKSGGQKVKLINGTRLYFDPQGQLAGKK